ncbi:MAG: hypothetical protein JWP03_2008 [Phycisphaerales bacterium]|nr:hypothetical protein [Phycisphaerales bacterium]
MSPACRISFSNPHTAIIYKNVTGTFSVITFPVVCATRIHPAPCAHQAHPRQSRLPRQPPRLPRPPQRQRPAPPHCRPPTPTPPTPTPPIPTPHENSPTHRQVPNPRNAPPRAAPVLNRRPARARGERQTSDRRGMQDVGGGRAAVRAEALSVPALRASSRREFKSCHPDLTRRG